MSESSTSTYICNACGWIYDPVEGDPDGGIAPGTAWEDIPDDWVCPVCGVGKGDFERVEKATRVIQEQGSEQAQAQATAPLVIVGSGLAGYSVVRELRKRDSSLNITIITRDGGEFYSKPMLSNAIAGQYQADDLIQKDAATMAKELDIEIITATKVVTINRSTKQLILQNNTESYSLNYDRLVLALGADPRIFPVEGQESIDISTVNDLDDYRHWREKLNPDDNVLLIGAGLIGCEFANDLVTAGYGVSIVDPAAWPLARLLPEAMGKLLVNALQREGCQVHMGCTVKRYSIAGSALQAELDNGIFIIFNRALSAVGLVSRIDLAREAGLEVQAGIIVDCYLRTSDPFIFALGDCAQTEAGLLPFIAPLMAEARVLAETLTGNETMLQLPALPVVVKTPALPLVVCPPPANADGSWTVEINDDDAVAVFRSPNGVETGFALAGNRTQLQNSMAANMPDLLSVAATTIEPETESGIAAAIPSYECDICSYIYDPEEGDPDGGIAPGTPFEDIPDDWVCPVCGAGKNDFTVIG